MSLVFLIPVVGLAVDVGFLYSAKAKLQGAVDGASLAAARSLNLGLTLSAQQASGAQNAVNWFYGNFPPGTWNTTNTLMDNTPAHVHIYTDATNLQLDHVDITATTSVPTYFMKWFGAPSTVVTAIGNATRRAAVVMLVLDRSGSMCQPSGNGPCPGGSGTLPCAAMVTAAKQFVGNFAEGRDYIGLVSFAENVYVHSAPTTNFQTTLGYVNNSGSGTGAIDNISCYGGTNTAQGVAAGYQLLYQTALPGALNILMLETDGLPNTLTLNFWDSANTVAGISSSSNCKDANNKTKSGGGFNNTAAIPAWTPGLNVTSAPFKTTTGAYSNIPAGIVGTVNSSDPGGGNGFIVMLNNWTTNSSNTGSQSLGNSSDPFNANTYLPSTATPSCGFNSSHSSVSDLAWFPATDVWGNKLDPTYITGTEYKSVTSDGQGHVTNPSSNAWTNFHNAALNATDNSAFIARSNATIPAYFFAIGLGGNSTTGPPDPILLQRMANDPTGDEFNASPLYDPCATETGCSTWAGQYQGRFIYTPNSSQLNEAFQVIASQILRLSK